MEGCHNDGNPKNNWLYNLRWDTHLNNEKDKELHGTRHFGEKQSYLTELEAIEARRLYSIGYEIPHISHVLNHKYITIYDCVTERTWNHLKVEEVA